jgi:hypothetical protein
VSIYDKGAAVLLLFLVKTSGLGPVNGGRPAGCPEITILSILYFFKDVK